MRRNNYYNTSLSDGLSDNYHWQKLTFLIAYPCGLMESALGNRHSLAKLAASIEPAGVLVCVNERFEGFRAVLHRKAGEHLIR